MYKKRILHVPYSIIHILSTSIFLFKRYLHTEVCVKYSAWQSLASPFSRSPSSVWDKHWTCLGAGKFVHRTLGPTSPNDDFCKLVWWKQQLSMFTDMGMDQYLLIPFLVGWTSIYQLFWCELQGYKVLTHCHMNIHEHMIHFVLIFEVGEVFLHESPGSAR